ncbi:MAG: PilZ domain-containing protein [Candidatus Zixiibacteriota bacterium]
MSKTTKAKFVSDIDVVGKEIKVRPPFRLKSENQRRYVRLEISAPMTLQKIKDIFGNFWAPGTSFTIDGTILNISPGGVLLEVDQPLDEGDILSMSFTLQGNESLKDVLGVVKRTDRDGTTFLAGVEFIGKNYLMDKLTQAELEMFSENLSDFEDTIQKMLKKYVYREQVTRDVE